ncbi:hypothetical protein, partial [Rhizobium tibeticum]
RDYPAATVADFCTAALTGLEGRQTSPQSCRMLDNGEHATWWPKVILLNIKQFLFGAVYATSSAKPYGLRERALDTVEFE